MRKTIGWVMALLVLFFNTSLSQAEAAEYSIGETWTVEGQWSMTVNAVEETDLRNQFWNQTPAAVYVVSYTYTNLGYTDPLGVMNGLYIGVTDSIVDCANIMGYEYPIMVTNYPLETPIGATCKAQAAIGVDNAGLPVKLYVSQYDGHWNKQTAVFNLDDESKG